MKVGKENQGKARREVKRQSIRTFLVVQQLRLCLPLQGTQIQTMVRKLRSHMPCSQKAKT